MSEEGTDKSKFITINTKNDLWKIIGSKYYQCDLDKSILLKIKNSLEENLIVLFGGTPCQVAAVKAYIPKKLQKNLVLVDIICQGVPSYKCVSVHRKYKEKQNNSEMQTHRFRCKDKYVGRNYLVKYCYLNGKTEYAIGEKDFYSRTFQRHVYLRESCYKCKFTNENRVGDITVGDLWEYPQEPDNKKIEFDKGVSVVVANTDKGTVFLMENKYIEYSAVDINIALKNNKPFHSSVKRPIVRSVSYKLLNTFGVRIATLVNCYKYTIKNIWRKQ